MVVRDYKGQNCRSINQVSTKHSASSSLWFPKLCCINIDFQAPVWISARQDNSRHKNHSCSKEDRCPARLWKLEAVVFQRGHCSTSVHIQLPAPPIRAPLFLFGKVWKPKDPQWHLNAKACHFFLGPSDVVSSPSVLPSATLTWLAELGIQVSCTSYSSH